MVWDAPPVSVSVPEGKRRTYVTGRLGLSEDNEHIWHGIRC
jgi:hypothetical protein